MRYGPIVLTTAALFALTHAAGGLLTAPVWRYAELASLGALLLYAVVSGLPAPRWAVPAALTVLLVDAVRTLPAAPSTSGWQILSRTDGVDVPSGFETALATLWAPLVAVGVLLVAWRPGERSSRVVTAAAVVAAVLIAGYAAARVISIGRTARDDSRADTVTATSLAVLPAVAVGLAAAALAVLLARNGRRLAAVGMSLLVVAALPHIDSGIQATPLPYSPDGRTGLFGGNVPPLVTTALESAAFLLLVAGVADWRHPPGANSVSGGGRR